MNELSDLRSLDLACLWRSPIQTDLSPHLKQVAARLKSLRILPCDKCIALRNSLIAHATALEKLELTTPHALESSRLSYLSATGSSADGYLAVEDVCDILALVPHPNLLREFRVCLPYNTSLPDLQRLFHRIPDIEEVHLGLQKGWPHYDASGLSFVTILNIADHVTVEEVT